MEKSVKNLNEIYEKYKHSYFTPEIESAFDGLGKYYGTYNFIKPYLKPTKIDDIEFYILDKHLDNFRKLYNNKSLVDENYKALNKETVIPILKKYGKGFQKGYKELKNELKPHIPENIESNRLKIFEIYSLIENKENTGAIAIEFINDTDINKKLKETYYNLQYFQVDEKIAFNSGYKGGLFYKAWEIILENRPFFKEIFEKKSVQNRNFYSKKPEKEVEQEKTTIEKKEPFKETPDLTLKGIPNFNLQQRFYIFKKLNLDNNIHQIDTELQKGKHKILALIMGISPDNAKHLLNDSYKRKLTPEQQAEVDEYLLFQKIKL